MSSVYVPLTDLMGSTLALVNSSDSVAAQYSYDPFGNSTASGQSLAYPYQFEGMALDQTGLYFNGSSYYDPAYGRLLEGYGAPNAPGGGQGGGSGLPIPGGGGSASWMTDYANAVSQLDIAVVSGLAAFAAASSISVGAEVGITFALGAHAGAVGLAVAAVVAIVEVVLDAFGISIFGGGGSRPTPSPPDYRHYHDPSATLIGVLYALVPDMSNSAHMETPCIEQLMFVTAYNNTGTTKSGASAGSGTVAEANISPLPYAMGSRVTVYDSPAGSGRVLYQGTIRDTGRGWDYINARNPQHSHILPPNDWIDIWLPGDQARQFGASWKWVRICDEGVCE